MTQPSAIGAVAPQEAGRTSAADRWRTWRRLGASDDEAVELAAYASSRFDTVRTPQLPLADEPHVRTWRAYAAAAAERGAVAVLRERLLQLRFPVRAGMSADEGYLAAVRRGNLALAPPVGSGAAFAKPSAIRLLVHPTTAGHIPVIIAGERADFVTLIQALTRHNEPVVVSDAMGACIVAGYNNWDRVASARQEWVNHVGDDAELTWPAEFARLRAQPELYQDRFIILSAGPYSATPAGALGLRDDEWLDLSLRIRLEHECAHYFTRRVFGAMHNLLLDELIADYTGIVAAVGRFRGDWLLRFMGLEDPDAYRETGRLGSYRGEPPLGAGAFRVLQRAVRRAVYVLESRDAEWRHPENFSVPKAIGAIARAGLEGLLEDQIVSDEGQTDS